MRGHTWRMGLLVLLVLAACAPAGGPAGPSRSPFRPSPSTSPAKPPPAPTLDVEPSASGQPDTLQVVVDDGAGTTTTWTLTCDPPGGSHPDPAAACAALERAAASLAPVPAGRRCTQQFGGPQTATVTGSWQGRPVDSRFTLTDGCEIGRWQDLEGLLPPAGA